MLPPDGLPTLLHPCLHEGYNRTYRRLGGSGREKSPSELVLLGRWAATVECRESKAFVMILFPVKIGLQERYNRTYLCLGGPRRQKIPPEVMLPGKHGNLTCAKRIPRILTSPCGRLPRKRAQS